MLFTRVRTLDAVWLYFCCTFSADPQCSRYIWWKLRMHSFRIEMLHAVPLPTGFKYCIFCSSVEMEVCRYCGILLKYWVSVYMKFSIPFLFIPF